MTESLVFGRKVVEAIKLDLFGGNHDRLLTQEKASNIPKASAHSNEGEFREITFEELAKHSSTKDLWVAIAGKVYDFSSFIQEHPGGVKPILDVAGKDGTQVYEEIHTLSFLEEFTPVGILKTV